MRQIELNPKVEHLNEMNTAYGMFDLDVNTCRPTPQWEHRNLHSLRLPFGLAYAFFPQFWIRRVLVNRRASEALQSTLAEISVRWNEEYRHAHGLDTFVRCYCFGDSEPSLFWYGAGWELSPKVSGEVLSETIKIFVKNGWTYSALADKRKLREFEFW